jgi:putative transposase
MKTWQAGLGKFIPFPAFPPELGRIVYPTNATKSLHHQLRKIIKNRTRFPNDIAGRETTLASDL